MSSDAKGKIAHAILSCRENIRLLDERVILTIREDLPSLDAALATMLDAL
jgi:hypothetical protein